VPAPIQTKPLRVTAEPDTLSLFWVDNVAIIVWHSTPNAVAVQGLYELSSAKRVQFPTGMSVIHIGRVQLAMMDAAARDVFVSTLRELKEYMAATAIVSPANGFWASTLRSVATGILVLARVPHEIRFHDRVEDVMEWLPARHREVTGVHVEAERLREQLAHAALLARATGS